MPQPQEYQDYHGYVDKDFLKTMTEHGQTHKQQVYQQMNVQPGHHILDVGCGPGTDTIPLAQLVGPTGQVIGIDHDEAMVAEANNQAEVAGVSDWVEHRVEDALALSFEDNQFDACHTERVLFHLSKPAQAFAEIVRVTKPGGRIALLEPDGANISVDTPEVEVERRIAQAWIKFHKSSYVGRQLYGFFKRHQFQDVSVEIWPWVLESLSVYRQIFRLDDIASKALEAGMVTPDELQRYETSLEEAEKIGAFFGYGAMVTVIGRKP